MKLVSAWKAVAVKGQNWDTDLASHLKSTGQDKLYQAPILQNCLNTLVDQGLIEEAYLRGSFRTGWADDHSDIDLFTVVDPKKMESALNAVRDHLEKTMVMITDCYDRYVPPYGGMGFTFLCKDKASGNVLQFDFYMAIKGVRGEITLVDVPRIYSRDSSYRWTQDPSAVHTTDHLPEETKKFISRYNHLTEPADRALLTFDEFMSVMHYFHKHNARGQTGRVMKDDAFLVNCCASVLEDVIGWQLGDSSPLYNVNRVVEICRKHGDDELIAAANRLDLIMTSEPTQKKMDDLYFIIKDIFAGAFPEKYEQVAKRVEMFEEHVLRKPLEPLMFCPASGKDHNPRNQV